MNDSVIGTILPGQRIEVVSCTDTAHVGKTGKIVAVYMKDGYLKIAVVLNACGGHIVEGFAIKDIKLLGNI